MEKVDVNIFDDTADTTLSLFNCMTGCPSQWTPSKTVLLILNPHFKASLSRPIMTLKSETLVDVDPVMADADWLRGYAQRLTKKECINPPFPKDGPCAYGPL